MKRTLKTIVGVVFAACIVMTTNAPAQWATAYYAGWQQGYNNTGYLPAQDVDYSAVTYVIHFALVPQSNGTLDDQSNSVTAYNANALVTAAHAVGKKVLICVGGWNSDAGFQGATSGSTLNTFVSNLINLMQSRGYDGIDIDWEPMSTAIIPQWKALITALRNAMNNITPRPLLTTANGGEADQYLDVIPSLDQLNYMSYDMSGAWPGWVTWHNSPIYDGGATFPSTGGLVPSTDANVQRLIAAGVPKNKIGIGIDFYGYVWSGGDGTPTGGVTAPLQAYTAAPTVQSNVPYSTIMDTYYQSQYDKWDASAQAAYLSIDNTGSANDKFISYDNASTVAAKFNYVRSKGLGGAIIWELGGGYRANQPAGQRDLLLQAVKQALNGSSTATVPSAPTLASPSNGATGIALTPALSWNASSSATSYGVQVSTNSSFSNLVVNQTGLTSTSFSLSGLVNSLLYYWRVSASNAAGTSGWSSTYSFTTLASTADLTPPTVSITSPANGAAVSGTITIGASASDNVGVAGVQLTVDGANFGSEITSAPYSTPLNTAQYANGTHTIAAVARDAAGNKATASVSVTISNTTPPPPASSSDLVIFQESLTSPWVNNSWSANVTYGSTDQAYAGSYSIKTALTAAWGAFSVHYGNWGSAGVNTSSYTSVDFAVYGATSGTTLSIFFENDGGQKFPAVNYGTIAAGQWTVISIPMSKLNPNNYTVNRLDIQDVSGSVVTFYIDNLRLTGTTTATTTADTTKPTVAFTAPANGTTVTGTITVSANATDNVNVAGVQFKVDGANLGSEVTTTPYSVSWNTTQAANGAHTLTAAARDSAGNTATASVTVTVSNSTVTPTSNLIVSDDSLHSPWIDASWSATVTFNSSEQHYTGSTSIKVVQSPWGALRVHSGAWGAPVHVNAANYASLDFEINGGSAGISLGVYFENDQGSTFPAVQWVWIAANKWTTMSIPMSKLNPNNAPIDRIVMCDMSGRLKTFYVDDIHFTAVSQQLAKSNETTGTETNKGIPFSFDLGQNYPNPFNPATQISYSLPSTANVRLEIFNTTGQLVSLLVNGEQQAGMHIATFNASSLPSGAYFYRITAADVNNQHAKPFVMTKRMILLK
ncbi:MAG: T9SS type A sorting domain-containing protein [Bacteroidota bacterium]|nr:T9SS type A sorting domain-containing protein [Bacteroidota bacterium]